LLQSNNNNKQICKARNVGSWETNLRRRKFLSYLLLTVFFDGDLRRHNDVILTSASVYLFYV